VNLNCIANLLKYEAVYALYLIFFCRVKEVSAKGVLASHQLPAPELLHLNLFELARGLMLRPLRSLLVVEPRVF